MQRLTDVLLGLDLSSTPSALISTAKPRPRPVAAEEPPSPPEETGPDEEASEPETSSELEAPWIDTPLCASCNDCTNLNPLLFLYNEDKQAMLGDLSSGTYAQMVQAAELCPAKCIHPGSPWNPDEPGLEELIERSAPFST
jgi:ferredoxin